MSIVALLLLSSPYLLSAPLNANIQTQKTSVPATSGDFVSCLQSLSRENRVAIVTEGQPLRTFLDAPVANVPDKTKATATAFDYDSRRDEKQVLLWRKRYTAPEDIPFFTPGEAAEIMRSVEIVTKPIVSLSFDAREDDLGESIFYRLSPKQWEQMKSGLPISTLPQEQRAGLYRYVHNLLFGFKAESEVGSVTYKMAQLADQQGAIEKSGDGAEGRVPRYVTPVRDADGSLSSVSLYLGESPTFMGQDYYGGHIGGGNPTTVFQSSQPQEVRDNLRPTEADAKRVQSRTTLQTVQTLQSVINVQNRREKNGWQYAVAPSLAAKPVQVFGQEFATSKQIVRACGEVYGLRVATNEREKTITLSHPTARPATTIASLAPEMSHIMPEPIARWLHVRERAIISKEIQAYNERFAAWKEWRERNNKADTAAYDDDYIGSLPAPWDKPAVKAWQSSIDVRWKPLVKSSSGTPDIALRGFRASVEPRIDASPQKSIPVSKLTDSEQNDLAAYFLCKFWSGTGNGLATDNMPLYLKSIKNTYLVGELHHWTGMQPGYEVQVSFEVCTRKADGSYDQHAGTAGSRLRQPEKLSVSLPPPVKSPWADD